jgi:hypothetical protein
VDFLLVSSAADGLREPASVDAGGGLNDNATAANRSGFQQKAFQYSA